MEFIVSSNELLKELQSLNGVISSNNIIPILDNFLFEINNNELNITGTDLETSMIIKMKIKSKKNGGITIPSKLLIDLLKTFPDQPLKFLIKEKGYLNILTQKGKYKISIQNSKEYPIIHKINKPEYITINKNIIIEAINKTLIGISKDELRPIMNGVYFNINNKKSTFVSTDSHKLIKYIRYDIKNEKKIDFIIPKKPLVLLKKISSNIISSKIKIEYNKKNTSFYFDNKKLICTLIEGKYPNYNSVIPDKNDKKLIINRYLILNSIKRLSLFSNKNTRQIYFKINKNNIEIISEDIDFSNKAKEKISCNYEGDYIKIGFNYKFLIEILSNINSDEIIFELSKYNKAVIIKPLDELKNKEKIIMLIMPVVVND